jgi:hypothetical protein
MKKVIIHYPSSKKIIIEIAGFNDILQHVQQETAQTAPSQELQTTTHGYVLLLVECTTESEHDAVCFVYVVPVKMESAKAGISANKIRRIAGEEFSIDVGSLRLYQTHDQLASSPGPEDETKNQQHSNDEDEQSE